MVKCCYDELIVYLFSSLVNRKLMFLVNIISDLPFCLSNDGLYIHFGCSRYGNLEIIDYFVGKLINGVEFSDCRWLC